MAQLLDAVDEREASHRVRLEERLTWDDVVLEPTTRQQLVEILHVFAQPDLARQLGVTPPAGVLLHGPPGTGKTTIAKVMAHEMAASFYEMSAADLLSKWVGESEQKVAKLFEKARANRPTIVFIDEIDGLLRRRSSASATPWEERVVSQFLRELDGLVAGQGVLLVGATNRLDIIDDAIVRRRLTPIEVGLPDRAGREALLRLLTRGMSLGKDVDLAALADLSEGMSGADLKVLRNAAGMKALSRAATKPGTAKKPPAVSRRDFLAALEAHREQATLLLT
jgi:transitional endoplasmic reticulum ATPase